MPSDFDRAHRYDGFAVSLHDATYSACLFLSLGEPMLPCEHYSLIVEEIRTRQVARAVIDEANEMIFP